MFLKFYPILCVCVCLCTTAVYTTNFNPGWSRLSRLTFTVSQLSHTNLSLSLCHTQIHGTDIKCILRAETGLCILNKRMHKQKGFSAHWPICLMRLFCFDREARRQLTATKQGKQKGREHEDESRHTTTTCSNDMAHTYLWAMEADTRLDWHVLAWALRSLLPPTVNREKH